MKAKTGMTKKGDRDLKNIANGDYIKECARGDWQETEPMPGRRDDFYDGEQEMQCNHDHDRDVKIGGW